LFFNGRIYGKTKAQTQGGQQKKTSTVEGPQQKERLIRPNNLSQRPDIPLSG